MKKIVLLVCVLLCATPFLGYAQQEVQMGSHRFVPEQNIPIRGGVSLSMGTATNGYYNTLVQFRTIPSATEIVQLEKQGIILGSYLGGNAYFAQVSAIKKEREALRGRTSLSSIVPVRAEWKIDPLLEGSSIPDYIRAGELVKVGVRYAANVTHGEALLTLRQIAQSVLRSSETFRTVELTVPQERIAALAALPWVLTIKAIDAPMQLNNLDAAVLNRAAVLRSSMPQLGARMLDGEGIKVGIWDGNVMQHPDFGERIVRQEYESQGQGSEEHGTHVAGSILGSGLLNSAATGLAPRATGYTYNFIGSNGFSSQEEMLKAKQAFGITLTSNSYGTPLAGQCKYYYSLVYRQNDYELDILASDEPTLSHQIAAGNEQSFCTSISKELYGLPNYGTSTWRAKNVIYVGAVDTRGYITDFSSFGPQDDGRMFPTIMAKGERVYSTQPGQGYKNMRGTSMACPIASGTLALLQQRYKQLYNNRPIRNDLLKAVVINTAEDAGRKGPDFQYGYGILNAENAVDCMERGKLIIDSVEMGKTLTFDIPVPKVGKFAQAKVTLVWNDAPLEKAVSFGESVLVNDLDLVVKGKDMYLPWVCDPRKGKVEELAVRAVDKLNNVEQITLTPDEMGDALKVTVTGSRVVNGHQPFAVAVWFEEVKQPRIISLGENEVLVPGEEYTVHHEGITSEYTIDLSYDDGATYKFLGRVEMFNGKVQANPVVKIPQDAPLTTKARFRILAKDGGVAISQFPLIVAPRVQGLKLVEDPCGISEMKLTWDKVEGDIEGYSILVCDGTKEKREVLAEVGKEVHEYQIPPDKVQGIAMPYFTIAVRLADKKLGATPAVVRTYAARPLKLDKSNLPFKENFHIFPSPYFRQRVGANMLAVYKPYTPELTPAANSLVAVTQKVKQYFNDEEYFVESNAPQMVTLEMCELDLSEIPSDKDVFLHVYARVGDGNKDISGTARFRVAVDNLGLVPIGRAAEEQKSVYGTQEYVYRIKGGTKHNVKIQFCGSVQDDNYVLSGISIDLPSTLPDVSLKLLKEFDRFVSPEETECRILVENHSSELMENVGLRVLVDGKWVATELVPELQAMSKVEVPVVLDLRTKDPLGAIREIELMVENENDPTPADNYLHFQYNYRGEVLCMPEATIEVTELGKAPVDPKATIVVDKPTIFTDCGGLYGNYAEYQESTLKIVPKDPSQRLRVTFKKFEARGNNAGLFVYTSSVPHNLALQSVPVKDLLLETLERPVSYISEATDGAITFLFRSLYDLGAGWEAEIDFVPKKNPLAITWAKVQLQTKESEAEVPVKMTLLNRWQTPAKDVKVVLWNGQSALMKYTIPELKSGESQFEFPEKLKLKARELRELGVFIEGGDDLEWKDNHYDVLAGVDTYCIPNSYRRFLSQWLLKLSFENRTIAFDHTTTHIKYTLDSVLDLYKGDGKVKAQVYAKKSIAPEQILLLYVDWNEDGSFAADERVNITALEDDIIPFEIEVPDGIAEGKKRARLMLVKTNEKALFPCGDGRITEADIHDFTIAVHEGENPAHNDLAITKVDIGETGVNLLAAQEIKITLQNLSNTKYDGKIKIAVDVDGTTSEEEYDFASKPLLPFTGSAKITLNTKANLASKGLHKVKVQIAEMPSLVNKENNIQEAQVWCNIPEPNGFYALRMRSNMAAYAGEYVALEKTTHNLSATGDFTLEFWINLEYPQNSYIFTAEQLQVLTLYKYSEGYPDNALALLLGSGQYSAVAVSKANALLPNQWNHVAIVVSGIQALPPSSTLAVYINGKRAAMDINGNGAPNLRNLRFAQRLNADVDALRIWSAVRTEDQIKAAMYTKLGSSPLPEGLVAEFMFDEGDGNAASFSGDKIAGIVVKDIARYSKGAPNTVWQSMEQLYYPLRDVYFDNQIRMTPGATQDSYNVVFAKGAAKQQKVSLRSVWEEAHFEYEQSAGVWTPLTSDTQLNFANPVKLKAKHTLFGKQLEQTASFVWEEDKASENKINKVTLLSKNQGLSKDIEIEYPNESQLIDLPVGETLTNPAAVALKVELPVGAKLRYRGNEVLSGEVVVDLTSPISWVVIAENGDSRAYTFRLSLPQMITWNPTQLEFTYGDAPIAHNATVQGGRVLFASDNSKSVNVAGDAIVFSKPGEAILTPYHPGTGLYKPVTGESKKFMVKKKEVRAFLDITSLRYAEPSVWKFRYEGLVEPSDASIIASSLAAYDLKNAKGEIQDATKSLAIGRYTLTPKSGATFENDYYKVLLQPAAFDVVQGDIYDVTFVVRTNDGTPLPNATIKFADKQLVTDTQGRITVALRKGEKFQYTVSKAGYSNRVAEYEVKAESPQVLEVIMKSVEVTITYSVNDEEMGVVVGIREQHLAKGEKTSSVVAIAKEGHVFVEWSDGKKEAMRVDENVEESKELIAKFRASGYFVVYEVNADEGGRWKRGEPKQEIFENETTTEVEVEPLDGYFFSRWNDYVREPARKDEWQDLDEKETVFTAYFDPYQQIPNAYGFENGSLTIEGQGWDYDDSEGATAPWVVSNKMQQENLFYRLDNYAAVLNAYELSDKTSHKISHLISTRYIIPEGYNSALEVKFDYLYAGTTGSQFIWSYSFDGKTWTNIGSLAEATLRKKGSFKLEQSELSGKKYVQFRWTYKTTANGLVMLDNFLLAPASATDPTLHFVATPAEGGLFKNANGLITDLQVKYGSIPGAVEAIAKDGYLFDGWNDGYKRSRRVFTTPILMDATYTANFRAVDLHRLRYKTIPEEGGYVEMDGAKVTEQLVKHGMNAKDVLAKPAAGFKFLRWNDNGATQEEKTMMNVQHDATLEAVFVREEAEVIVQLTNAGKKVVGAQIAIQGQLTTTNTSGEVALFLPFAKYTVIVKATGYQTKTFDIVVHESKHFFKFELTDEMVEPKYRLQFIVQSAGEPVEGVNIQIGDAKLQTSSSGEAELMLAAGTFRYKVEKEGYEAVEGDISIVDKGIVQKIELKKIPTPGGAVEDAVLRAIAVAPNPFEGELYVMNPSVEGVRYELLTVQGHRVLAGELQLLQNILRTENLPEGIYLLRLSLGTHQEVRRLVKQ
ncbi:MAG: S8 family serine peptidase [Bacteroides sp.]